MRDASEERVRCSMRSLLLVFVLIVWAATAMESSESGDAQLRWAFILLYYHKTGHNLAYDLLKPFSSFKCPLSLHGKENLPLMWATRPGKQMPCGYITEAAELTQAWFHSPRAPRVRHRLVHFVRDPLDMVLSGYLYHSQLPPPESWLKDAHKHLCQKYPERVVRWLHAIGEMLHLSADRIAQLKQNIQNVVWKCEQKMRELPDVGHNTRLRMIRDNCDPDAPLLKDAQGRYSKNPESYSTDRCTAEAARESVFEAIRYESFRGLETHITVMAYNSLKQLQVSPTLTKKMMVSFFPMSNLTKYEESVREVYAFIMPEAERRGDGNWQPCWANLTVDAAANMTMRKIRLDQLKNTGSVPGKSTHVTQQMMSEEDRAYYMQRLADDSIVGPILTVLRQAVFSEEENVRKIR